MAQRKPHPADLAGVAEAVANAQGFVSTLILGRGRYEKREAPTLEAARNLAAEMTKEAATRGGRKALVYALLPNGGSALVPEAYAPPADDLSVPDFLKIPQEQRDAYWRDNPPKPLPVEGFGKPKEPDPELEEFEKQEAIRKKAKASNRIGRMLAKKEGQEIPEAFREWDAVRCKFVDRREVEKRRAERALALAKGATKMQTQTATKKVSSSKAASKKKTPAKKAAAAPAPKKTEAAPSPYRGIYAEQFEAAQKGKLPPPPDFSANTHTRFRPGLAELVKMAKAGDIKKLKAYPIKPISTSPKAMDRYRNLCVIALEAKK